MRNEQFRDALFYVFSITFPVALYGNVGLEILWKCEAMSCIGLCVTCIRKLGVSLYL